MRTDRVRKPFTAVVIGIYSPSDKLYFHPFDEFVRHDSTKCKLPCRLLMRNVVVQHVYDNGTAVVTGYVPAIGGTSNLFFYLIEKDGLRLVA